MAQRTVNLENVEALVSELETLPPIASMPALVALAGSLLKAANVAKLQSEFRLFHHQGYGDELEGSVWWSLRGLRESMTRGSWAWRRRKSHAKCRGACRSLRATSMPSRMRTSRNWRSSAGDCCRKRNKLRWRQSRFGAGNFGNG